MHRLRTDPRILDIAQGYDGPGGLSRRSRRVQRAHGLDLRVNERFTATDGDHGRVALLRRPEAILQAHHVLERSGIFANPPATGASQIARVQRLELKHRGELFRATQFVADHVSRDLSC